jgi:hypothetical protein
MAAKIDLYGVVGGAQTAYIAGAFAAGTALCCGAAAISWYLTKQTMGVKDVCSCPLL